MYTESREEPPMPYLVCAALCSMFATAECSGTNTGLRLSTKGTDLASGTRKRRRLSCRGLQLVVWWKLCSEVTMSSFGCCSGLQVEVEGVVASSCDFLSLITLV